MSRKAKAKIAFIYDFDGTLGRGNMHDHSFIPEVGMQQEAFWKEVQQIAVKHQADQILVYMQQMIKKAAGRVAIKRESFKKHGKSVPLYPGVEEWFGRLNTYVKSKGLVPEHYIISCGVKEMIEGTAIAKNFERIFASSFFYDEQNGHAIWPATAVNYTTKTQYLFRINKQVFNEGNNYEVNEFVTREERPIPFTHMVYIGDSDTDIPCMRLVKQQGGISVAVMDITKEGKTKKGKIEKARKLLQEDRINYYARADYSEGQELEKIVKAAVNRIASLEEMKDLQG